VDKEHNVFDYYLPVSMEVTSRDAYALCQRIAMAAGAKMGPHKTIPLQ